MTLTDMVPRSPELEVVILGAGVRGASLAAILAASGVATVQIVDPRPWGSGISSTNHGRFHSGTWNYPINSDDVIVRDRESWEIARQLPNVWETTHPGLYCIESPDFVGPFAQRFPDAIQIGAEDLSSLAFWFSPERYTIFEIPEYSFDPALLAVRLIRYALSSGKATFHSDAAQRLVKCGERFQIHLSNAHVLDCDVVVNAMGGWMNLLEMDVTFRQWHPKEFVFNCWRLLCVDTASLDIPKLDRVVTIDRLKQPGALLPGPLGAVPHDRWVVFGCDMAADEKRSQDELPPGAGWRPYDSADRMDSLLYHSHLPHFPYLSRALDAGAIFSFPGVYPEPRTAASLDRQTTGKPTEYKPVSISAQTGIGYYPFYGGATTALADARDASTFLLQKHAGVEGDKLDSKRWISEIARSLRMSDNKSPMIWRCHE